MSPRASAHETVTLRAGCPEDLPAIRALLEGARLPLAGVPDALSRLLVAEVGGELAGVAGLERYGTSALLRSVAVAPHHQGKGIGAAMIGRLLEEARCECIQDVYLRTTTGEGYFPRFGFSPVHVADVPLPVQDSVEFQGACPASAVTMACCLGPEVSPAESAASLG